MLLVYLINKRFYDIMLAVEIVSCREDIMKVIFLDIDGVLNSDEYFDKIRDLNIQGIQSEIDVEKIKL